MSSRTALTASIVMPPPRSRFDRPPPRIPRANLRVAIRRALLQELQSGRLKPGSRINEREIADALGVSRTPLREALLQLEFEGFVEASPNKGFSVTQPTPGTIRDLYEVVGSLEGLALRMAGVPNATILARILELDGERAGERDLGRMIELDASWHDTLLSGCANRQLLEVLHLLKSRLYRFEWDFMGDPEHVDSCLEQHRHIIAALREGDLETGARRLEKHWHLGALVDRLSDR